jgi:hypothetical protein
MVTASMQVVRDKLPQHVMFRFGDIHWLSRSPDLSVCDYFLGVYLKSKVYVNQPCNIQELKNSIRLEIANLEEEMLGKAMENFKGGCKSAYRVHGRYFSEVIHK